jgi:serine protease AprX
MTPRGRIKRRTIVVAVAASMALLLPAPAALARGTAWTRIAVPAAPVDASLARSSGRVSVIVQATSAAQVPAVRAAAVDLGATIKSDLPIIDGFSASLPAHELAELARIAGVRSITKNTVGRFEELSYDEGTTASSFARTSGATTAWGAGNLGEGVGVAVLDTGIAPMNDFSGRLVSGPDLSGEGTLVDTYGHGTVMAGVIGGSGADSAAQAGGAYTGVAPKATLVAVKVAGRNGVVDVSTVLQAMHWVSAYKDQFNIRVLNLSWGTASKQDPAVDPLNYAVERLWKQGIVVVVAAGNAGPNSGTITKPADDPMVLTVGAYDDKQNSDPNDDVMGSWSSRGPTPTGLAKPDLVAPGRYIIASRAYGSRIEAENPKALQAPSYIRGTGTSQAAAVTSGAVALLLKARPELTPDQVKAILKGTAAPIGTKSVNDQGAGRLALGAALGAPAPTNAAQTSNATGLGSIEKSRGGRNVQVDCGNDGTVDQIIGEIDVRCEAWNGASWTGASWTGASWTGASWTGASWTGASWTGASWTGASWTGASWTGGTWSGASWTGASWTGASWTGSAWSGASWTGASWTGASWTGASWTTSNFTSSEYDDFLTVMWGTKTKPGRHVPGEQSETPGFAGTRVA